MNTILKEFIGQHLSDVHILGVVAKDENPVEFLPILDAVYLHLGDDILRLCRDEPTARLRIEISGEAIINFEMETDHEICRSSIGAFVLNNHNADNRIGQFVLHDYNDNSVGALEVVLHSGQILFFDPTFFEGINFGGIEQKLIWIENSTNEKTTTIS